MRISDWSSDVCSSDLIRGSRWDYDNWAAMGCAGWSYNDVLPYFRRSEGNVRGGDDYHGGEGPLTVRSEERRVGKERVSTCRSRWSADHQKKKTKTQYVIKQIIST